MVIILDDWLSLPLSFHKLQIMVMIHGHGPDNPI